MKDSNKPKTDNLKLSANISNFIQSDAWARLNQSGAGLKIGLNHFQRKNLGGGFYYLYGPKIDYNDFKNNFQSTELAKGCLFLRLEPWQISETEIRIDGLVPSLAVQPRKTVINNLDLAETDLLKAMHSKTRYNVRLAEKKNLKLINDNTRIGDFIKLLKLTADRDAFRLHNADYYRRLAELDSGFIKLFLVEYNNQVLAAGLFCFYKNTITYLHGASANQNRQLMAPYFLHWQIMRQAAVGGFAYYDWYGIDERKWPGVTRFKLGFGGELIEYPGAFDYPLQPRLYKLYKLARNLRRLF